MFAHPCSRHRLWRFRLSDPSMSTTTLSDSPRRSLSMRSLKERLQIAAIPPGFGFPETLTFKLCFITLLFSEDRSSRPLYVSHGRGLDLTVFGNPLQKEKAHKGLPSKGSCGYVHYNPFRQTIIYRYGGPKMRTYCGKTGRDKPSSGGIVFTLPCILISPLSFRSTHLST